MKEELKKALLNMAENHMMVLLDDMEAIGELMVASTETPYDDMALQGLKLFKPELKKLIDKIDGEEG